MNTETAQPKPRKPIAYLEAVVRIPLYEGDEFGDNGPGAWWEYAEPQWTSHPHHPIGTCNRTVTEISRRIVRVDGTS